ncbi:hypothetical protein Tco_0889508 [Tanacetum coccineum]
MTHTDVFGESCMCLKESLRHNEGGIQHTSNLENALDFEEEILDEEVHENGRRCNFRWETRTRLVSAKNCARKGVPIRSPTGIGADLGEHLAPMKRPDKIPIEDRGGFGGGLLIGFEGGLLIGFEDRGWPPRRIAIPI